MAKNYDKFYTKSECASACVEYVREKFIDMDLKFFEPSAGSGRFLEFLGKDFIAIDLKPEGDTIQEMDFFNYNIIDNERFCIGNPPFGHRSSTAINFLNHASTLFDAIGFIVPVSFMKWNVQKDINKDFKLISINYLPINSFTDNGKDYEIRTAFQIWIKKDGFFDKGQQDLRMLKSPPISHPDINIWQHNATAGSRKYVDEAWEIATHRQGYKNFNEIFTKKDDYEYLKDKVYNTNQQFFFIQPLTNEAREIIKKIDFDALADRNTSVKGFGKADFISLYIEMKEQFLKERS